ncbi:hypothetical protein GGR09_000347 [Bartonella heixiaziensis]
MAKSHLPRANAWIETTTFAAILLGTVCTGLSFYFQNELQIITALIIIIFALFSWVTSCFMPDNIPAQSDLIIDRNIIRATTSTLKESIQDKRLLIVSLIISWFWFIGATLLSVIPILTASLNCLPHGTIIFLMFFSIFGAMGSAIATWLSAERINLLLPVIGTLVFGFSCIDLSVVINSLHLELKVKTLSDFFSHSQLLHIMFDFALAAISGTFLVILGFSALQAWAEPNQQARVIVANNILNAAISALGAGIITFIQYLGASLYMIILMPGIASLIAAIALLKYMPTNPFRDIIFILFHIFFYLEIKSIENLSEISKSPILIFNHSSSLNCFLALVICEIINLHNLIIVIDANTAKLWWFCPFIKHINAFPVDSAHPFANRYLIRTLTQGRPLIISSKGNIAATHPPMKIYGLEHSFFQVSLVFTHAVNSFLKYVLSLIDLLL